MLLMTIFLCGAAAGALTVRLTTSHAAPGPYWKEGGRELTLEMMRKELQLTPDQAAQIETVLDEFVLYYQNLQGQMDDFRSDGKQRITSFHPTSKPTRLFEIPMEQHTRPGAVVLEPFSGSGSQVIAAEKLRRRCFACDIQPAFVDGTILRWQMATGKMATLDGRTFEAVATERRAS